VRHCRRKKCSIMTLKRTRRSGIQRRAATSQNLRNGDHDKRREIDQDKRQNLYRVIAKNGAGLVGDSQNASQSQGNKGSAKQDVLSDK